jgi:hypothetical protein
MAKNFDAQEFLIQKGERVGLFVALILMIALVGFGMADGITADSVDKTVDTIQTKSRSIEERLASGPAGIDVIQPLDLIYTKTNVVDDKINPNDYLVATPFFRETPLENRKRTNPVVLQPDEFNPVLVRGAVQSMMILAQKDRVQMGVLIPLDKSKTAPQLTPQQKMWMDAMQQRLAMMQAMGMRLPPGVNPAAPGGLPGVAADAGPSIEYRLDWVDAAKIPANAEPAMTVTPVRMAVISGSFPYRAQLEIYRAALRKDSLNDLVKENNGELIPHFLQFNVRRRALDHTGKEKETWRELNLDTDFKPVLVKALGSESETPEIRRLSNHGMVMPRPILAVGKYPDTTPGLVNKALRAINQKLGKDSDAKVLSQMEKRLAGDGLDIFGAQQAPPDDKIKPKDAPAPRGEPELIVPDHCLVRFIDVTVQPGFTYEYQVQIRVQNPNYGKKTEVAFPALAEPKEIASQWSEKPCSITVPRETYVYGIELDERALKVRQQTEPRLLSDKNDVTFMQIHRWIETTNINPEQRGASVPVGDWSVGDCAVRRGEQIGRLENVKVPMWFPNKKAFEIAVPIQAAPKPGIIGGTRPQVVRGIPINFTTDELLVDFEGGSIRQSLRLNEKTTKPVSEEANVEYLVMSADGKLRLKQSRADKVNSDRTVRFEEWDKRVKDVESGLGKLATGGGDKPTIKDPFGKK